MATTTLQKITANAKKLVKANPKLKWQEAIKKASAELKKAPVKVTLSKSVKTNVGAKPTKKHVDTKSHNVNIKVGASTMHQKTYITLTDIGNELLHLEHLIKNKELSIAQKNVYKNQFSALKKYLNTRAKFVSTK